MNNERRRSVASSSSSRPGRFGPKGLGVPFESITRQNINVVKRDSQGAADSRRNKRYKGRPDLNGLGGSLLRMQERGRNLEVNLNHARFLLEYTSGYFISSPGRARCERSLSMLSVCRGPEKPFATGHDATFSAGSVGNGPTASSVRIAIFPQHRVEKSWFRCALSRENQRCSRLRAWPAWLAFPRST